MSATELENRRQRADAERVRRAELALQIATAREQARAKRAERVAVRRAEAETRRRAESMEVERQTLKRLQREVIAPVTAEMVRSIRARDDGWERAQSRQATLKARALRTERERRDRMRGAQEAARGGKQWLGGGPLARGRAAEAQAAAIAAVQVLRWRDQMGRDELIHS